MKAIIQDRYGPAARLELRDVPRPSPGDEEVMVRVRAASLHPDVWHVVTGRPWVLRLMGAGLTRPKQPIPGTDLAGIVKAAGRDVKRFRPGDEVFGLATRTHEWANAGALAEYACVPEAGLAPKPANVTFEQAASVPTPGFIALFNLPALDEITPGQKILVNGAGGGVGTIAVQLAKSRGAQVTAVDRASKLDMLSCLGADRVLDCEHEDFTRAGVRYDLVVDVPGNRSFSACRLALRPEGRYVLIGHDAYGASGRRVLGLLPRFLRLMVLSRFTKQLGRGHSPRPDRHAAVAVLGELMEAGTLTPIVDSTFPLAEARGALRHMIENEPKGKVVLTP